MAAIDVNDVMNLVVKSGAVGMVAERIGIDEKTANTAVKLAVPLLLSGMQGQMKNKDTKDGFLKALKDHSTDDTKDLKKAVKNADAEDGAKIVKHLLGNEVDEVAAKAKKKSGIDAKTILKIMAILAPILMSKMGQTAEKETAKSGSGDIGSVVGGLLDGVDAGDVVKLLNLLAK